MRLTTPREPESPREAVSLLPRILYWTGGHPYLTQRLCRAVAEHASSPSTDERRPTTALVDQLCEGLFFTREAREADDNLAFVRNRLLRAEVDLAALLDLYQRLRQGKRVVDDETNPLATLLRLSGVARSEKGVLQVRNRIYERVFDRGWVETHMPDAELRRQRAAYRRGVLRATAISGLIMAVMGVLALAAVRSEGRAKRALALVRHERDRALTAEQQQRTLRVLAQAAEGKAARSASAERAAARQAKAQQQLAQRAAAGEADQRRRAEESAVRAVHQERLARLSATNERAERQRNARLLYGADMQLAARAWEEGFTKRMSELLTAHHPKPGEADLRGFDWRYQWHLLHRGTVTFPGHGGAPLQGAFGPDGRLVTVDEDMQLRWWDRASRRATRTLDLSDGGRRFSPALAPDGRTLAARAPSGDIEILDTATGRRRTRFRGHGVGGARFFTGDDRIRMVSLAFSDDGRHLLSLGEFDRTVRIWNVATGQEVHRISQLHKESDNWVVARNLALSPDGRTLALACCPDMLSTGLFDLRKRGARESLLAVMFQGGTVPCVAFSPDGKIVVSGDSTGEVIFWDAATRLQIRTLAGHTAMSNRLAFSPDGRTLATGGWDARVLLWDVATGRQLRALKGHTAAITFLAFAPDGKTLASGSRDGSAKLWDLTSTTDAVAVHEHTNIIRDLAYSPDGRRLVTVGWDRAIRIWDTHTARLIRTLPGQYHSVLAVQFSPDGRIFATGGWNSEIKLWEAKTGRELAMFTGFAEDHRPWYGRPATSVAFSPDGKRLAVGFGHLGGMYPDYDGNVKIWDWKARRVMRTLKGHRNTITALAFAPRASRFGRVRRMLMTGSQDGTVKLWDTGTWRPIRTLTDFENRVIAAALSPDGRSVAVGNRDGLIQIRDLGSPGRTTRPTVFLRGHTSGVGDLAFSPDGRTLVSGSGDKSVKLWEVVSGRESGTLRHPSSVDAVAFSPDGNTLATGDSEGTLRFWEAASPREIERATGTDARVQNAPLTASAIRRAAEEALQKKQWAVALRHLDRLTHVDPKRWRTRLDRGLALARLNRAAEANADFARAAALAPGDPMLWVERARIYDDLGRRDRATIDYLRAIDRGGGEPMIWYRQALVGIGLANTQADQRLKMTLLAHVLARTPRDHEPWIERARVHMELREWPQAAADFTRAIALRSDLAEAWVGRGNAGSEQQHWKQAADDFAKAIELGTEDAWLWFTHVIARRAAGDADASQRAAARTLARFARTEEADVAAPVALAVVVAPVPGVDPAEPIRLAQTAVAHRVTAFGQNWFYLHVLALAQYRAGQFEAALRTARESLGTNPEGDTGVNWLILGLAHHRLGHAAEAHRWLGKGLGWTPSRLRYGWDYRLIYQILRQEAAALPPLQRPGVQSQLLLRGR